jgi:hypothetical protein
MSTGKILDRDLKIYSLHARRKHMKRSSLILICIAVLMMTFSGVSHAAYTPADIAGKWESGGHVEWVLNANGTFSNSYKDSKGAMKSFTGTFTITNDTIKFKKADGKSFGGTYKILSLSADKKTLNVQLGVSKQIWKKK